MQDVTYIGLVAAFVFLLILLAVMRKEKLGHEWEIILSSIRMTVQLILVGFILTYIFDNSSVWFSLIALLLMLSFAVINTFQRVENVPLDMKKTVAMFVGTGMMGMGIVFLPGMMTGQILAGAPPLEAIKYQIAIMLGIMGSVTFTVYIVIKLSSKTFFNHRGQLK